MLARAIRRAPRAGHLGNTETEMAMDELIARDPGALDRLARAVEEGSSVRVSDFARLTGTNESAVLRAWRDGRLPSAPGGCIPVREGLVALIGLGGLRKGKPVPGWLQDSEGRARSLLGLPDRPENDADVRNAEAAEWKLKYLKAQTAARTASAQATQMRNEIARGNLVKRAEVELDAAEAATNTASVLSRIPERVAGMCVGCTAEEIAVILRREILIALEAIQAATYTSDWKAEP